MIKFNIYATYAYTRCPNDKIIIDRIWQNSDNCQDPLCMYVCKCIYTYNI